MNEVVALVKINSELSLVMKEPVELRYKRKGNIIYGIDSTGTFVQSYFYERPVGRFKAFAGREFDITLEDGEVIHCNGQWWSGGTKEVEEILGKSLVSASVESIEGLKKCYVFTGCVAVEDKIEDMYRSYKGKVYENHEYRNEIKKMLTE